MALVVVTALLVVPRPVIPSELPLPVPDRDRLHRARSADAERSRRAERNPLPYEVRAVGEALRRYGLAEAARDQRDLGSALGRLRRAADTALESHGVEPLLTLCAVQTELFLRALGHWEESGSVSPDLKELGGAFLDSARSQRWLVGTQRLTLSDGERRVLFRMRWLNLTGLRKARGFRPALNDLRAYYRMFLERSRGTDTLLEVVAALSKIDPEYPAELARGLLFLRRGDRQRAAQALQSHLAGPKSAYWRLRARNALAAAVQF